MAATKASRRNNQPPTLVVGDALGAGDSYIVTDLLSSDEADAAFEKMKIEVDWKTMHHRSGEVPRLVAVQGEIAEDGSFPIYRHPADESPPLAPFSHTVALIRERVQQVLKHPVNHVLIQHYRSGKDYISDHSDKTIDVVQGSSIVNVSLGAQRTMTLRMKKDGLSAVASDKGAGVQIDTTGAGSGGAGTPRLAQRIPLPHNSMFVMGLETNAKWLHGINHDNRPLHTKSPEEQAFEGGRISLTFRHIGTFLSKDESRIWGQGARSKEKETAGLVVYDKEQVGKLIQAFGDENQKSDFDWDAQYGCGFDLLHFTAK